MAKKDAGEGEGGKKKQEEIVKEKEPGFWDLVTFAPEIFPGTGITYEKWRENFEYEARLLKEKREEKARKKAEDEALAKFLKHHQA